jgi:hypothetical protein
MKHRHEPTVEALARPLTVEGMVDDVRDVVVVGEVGALEEVRNPADATLGQGEGQLVVLVHHRRPHEVSRGRIDVDPRARDAGEHRGIR